MGRWSQLDSDEARLPEGMTRIAYDADTQVYTYRDSDGSHWETAPGVRYGTLRRVAATPPLPVFEGSTEVDGDEPPYILYDDEHAKKTFKELWSAPPPLAKPEKAHLRRFSSLSRTARRFLPELLPLSGEAFAVDESKGMEEEKRGLGKRRSTISALSRETKGHIKRRLTEKS
ncbi:hypothetical protein B0H67DRAFT_646123 [Lasiosphaeris hirsuta]|uniref:Uncharacterized protein n=1 Tax=Lasiosphaeris hirsuta TaxID=260670 RepID=A0AA40A7N7_9PEZI|nr:hypothetical protein B0H67DRAFT_646123 [Lasiosphaeris hirsuta]